MAVILAVANQKGGVGKTTTAVTLAALWARAGSKVLLIDLDSQGNVADSLGMGSGKELAMLLTPGIGIFQPVWSGREGLEVIRSGHETAELKLMLGGVMMRERVLERALREPSTNMAQKSIALKTNKRMGIMDLFDVVVLDVAPSVDLLHVAALVASDYVLVPTRLDQLAIKGVRDEMVSLRELGRAGLSKAKVCGVLPTFYERQTRESQGQLENLVRVFGEMVLPPIPVDTNVREANRMGKTIVEFDGKSRSVVGVDVRGEMVGGYEQVVERLEGRMG